jgi:hypothetical protein
VLDRLVAMKRLRTGFDDEAVRLRFAREARILAALQHPNVVNVFDYFEHECDPFLVMEFLEGETLRAVIAERRPWSLARKLEVVGHVCAGLDCVHRAGIIHRDVKPANLMLTRDGNVKLLDFGVAKAAGTVLTLPRMQLGSPNYMSPEQIRGEAIDARSDIFALTTVLYELVAFKPPFPGDVPQAFNGILHADPARLGESVPDVPASLERLILRGLAKDREHRIGSAAQLGRDLALVRGELGGATTLRVPGDGAFVAAAPDESVRDRVGSLLHADDEPPAHSGRRQLTVGAIAIVCGLAFLLLVAGLWPRGAATPTAPGRGQEGTLGQDRPRTGPDDDKGSGQPKPSDVRPTGTFRSDKRKPAIQTPTILNPAASRGNGPREPETDPPPVNHPAGTPQPGDPPAAPAVISSQPESQSDDRQIREVLSALERAHNERKAQDIKSLYPALSHSEVVTLERTFLDYVTYAFTISGETIQTKGDLARVSCRMTRSYTRHQGDSRNVTASGVISLRKVNDAWEITDIVER